MTSALALTVSTRAAAGVYEDRTGPLVAAWMTGRGYEMTTSVVADGPEVDVALRLAVEAGIRLIVTTGGTGVSPADRTPEATRDVIELELPGFGEELRRRGTAVSPHALLSRGIAGTVGRTLIVNLPGSPGGVRDGLGLLGEIVDHLLDQLGGGDHG